MVMIAIQDLSQSETLDAKARKAVSGGYSGLPSGPWHDSLYLPSYEVPDVKVMLENLMKGPSPIDGPPPGEGPWPVDSGGGIGDGAGGPIYGPY